MNSVKSYKFDGSFVNVNDVFQQEDKQIGTILSIIDGDNPIAVVAFNNDKKEVKLIPIDGWAFEGCFWKQPRRPQLRDRVDELHYGSCRISDKNPECALPNRVEVTFTRIVNMDDYEWNHLRGIWVAK